MRPRDIVRDFRALARGAPLRALYEASKAAGGHRILFGSLPRASKSPAIISPFPTPAAVPDPIRATTMATAQQISAGYVELFGREIEIGRIPDWHAAIENEATWPRIHWWKIDLRSDRRPADVKWVWELNRHRHLVILARAAHLDPDDSEVIDTLNLHLRSWLEQNPLEVGVHWYSNLEIALRSLSWLQVITLAGDQLDPDVRSAMATTLYHSGRHLVRDLPYTLSTMRNNHLLGDMLGLVALGKAFPSDAAARRWSSRADRILVRHLRNHFRSDGSTIEDSLSYSRFVLEMLMVRQVLGDSPPELLTHLAAGTQFLARLGATTSEAIPQYGDWDEGRVLAVTQDPLSITGATLLGAATCGGGALDEWRAQHDECAWYSQSGIPMNLDVPESKGNDLGGGIARLSLRDWTAWLKAGSAPSHGHADLLSVSISRNGTCLVGDPGTGTYNGDLAHRTYFRSSRAHNVLRVDGVDQLEPHRVFRWRHRAQGVIGDPIDIPETSIIWGMHNAYCRLDPSRRIVRAVVATADSITTIDWVEGAPTAFELSIPLHPTLTLVEEGLVSTSDERFALDLPGRHRATIGSTDPYEGWWSSTYGHAVPTATIELSGTTALPVVWSIRRPGTPSAKATSDGVTVAPVSVSVRWQAAGATLDVAGATSAVSMPIRNP